MGDKDDQKHSLPKDIPVVNRGAASTHSPNMGPSAMFSTVPASPPSFVSVEQLLKAMEDVSMSGFNMALAHEIAVNRDFRLEEKNHPQNSLEEKVTEMFHKAFWDLLAEQLSSDPPVYDQALVLFKEIKEVLQNLLLPYNARLRNEIDGVLDVGLIEQQVSSGTVEVQGYAQFIISTMARICAPARDENIQQLRNVTDVVQLYKGILETLDLMKLDMANYTISKFRPHIQQHSVHYEQKKFKEILHSLESLVPPVDGLKFTRLWLQGVVEQLGEDGADTSTVLRKAYVKILTWKDPENFPETLHLDHERFIHLRDNLTVMVLTATVILVTFSNVGPAIQGIADFKDNLKKHVQILLVDAPQCSASEMPAKMESVGLQVAKDTNECLEKHGFSALSKEQEAALVTAIGKVAAEEHHVRQLIMKRVLEFLELALHASSHLQVPPGLSTLQAELSSLAGQFLSLAKHNQAVFGEYYDNIVRQMKGQV